MAEGEGAWLKDHLALPDGVNVVDEFEEADQVVGPEYSI